jgi:hypothetical protein
MDVYMAGQLQICSFNTTSHAHLFDEYGTVGQTVLIILLPRSAVCTTDTSFIVRPVRLLRLSDEPGKEITFPLSVSLARVPPSRSPDHGRKSCKNVLLASLTLPTKNVRRSISLPFWESRVRAPNTAPPPLPVPHPPSIIVDLGTCEAVTTVVGSFQQALSHFGQECHSTLCHGTPCRPEHSREIPRD